MNVMNAYVRTGAAAQTNRHESCGLGESQRREELNNDMGGGKCLLGQAMLAGEWWHGRPMVVHVGDVVCAKNVQVTRSKNCGVVLVAMCREIGPTIQERRQAPCPSAATQK